MKILDLKKYTINKKETLKLKINKGKKIINRILELQNKKKEIIEKLKKLPNDRKK
jgi:hypothetical protein